MTESQDAQKLAMLFQARFALMPAIAAYKKKKGLPIRDKAQEAQLLARLSEQADCHGYPFSGRLSVVFEALIDISVSIQQGCLCQPLLDEVKDLKTVLRPQLAQIDEAILLALGPLELCPEGLEQAFRKAFNTLTQAQHESLLHAIQKAAKYGMA